MKYMIFTVMTSAFLLLRGCGPSMTKADVKTGLNDSNSDRQTGHDTRQLNIETRIIRELHNSGCLIKEFALDRRRQNLRVSCASDLNTGNTDI